MKLNNPLPRSNAYELLKISLLKCLPHGAKMPFKYSTLVLNLMVKHLSPETNVPILFDQVAFYEVLCQSLWVWVFIHSYSVFK